MATAQEIRDWFAANPGASDALIAQAMQANNVSSGDVASALGVDPVMVAQRYAAATAPTPVAAPAPAATTSAAQQLASLTTPETWVPGASTGLLNARKAGQNDQQYYGAVALAANKWLANPGTAAEAFDAMVKSGISVSDLLNAGISQSTIDNAFTAPSEAAQKQVNTAALNSMTSMLAQNPLVATEISKRGIEEVYAQARNYVDALQQGGLTDAERNQLREAATAQGWGYADIRAAGLDPMLLFGAPKSVVPPPVVPLPVVPKPVVPVFQPPTPYTPVTVYDPNKFAQEQGGADLYAKGVPALDVAFRESPVRTVSPVTGQYMYMPAAKLRPATGAGWSWTPPVVTSRPRQLLDVGPTASASQLYAQGRSAQDRALRNAFASRNLPMSAANTYYWQSRLRGGDYSPGGVFDPNAFQADFDTWSANLPPTGGGPATGSTTEQLQPQMFLNMQPQMFAEGGDVTASRKMLERIALGDYVTKKAEGGPVEVPPEVPSRSTSADQYEDVFKDIPLLSRIGEYAGGLFDKLKYGIGETSNHAYYNNALRSRLREIYPELKTDTQDNGLLDAAVKYAGAYDWAVRPNVEPEDARSMAHAYQLYDYNRENRNPQDEVSDYVRNMAGVEAGIKDRAEGRRLSDEDLFRTALEYAVSQTGGTMPLGKVDLWLREARKAIPPAAEELPVKKKDGGEVTARNLPRERMNARRARAGMEPFVPQAPTKTAGQAAADMLSGMSVPLSVVPVAGDVAGLAADAAMYAAYPEERTLANYGLTALGALPFVPAASAARTGKKAAEALKELSEAERKANLDRFMAYSQVIDEEGNPLRVYHITRKDFDQFKPGGFDPELSGPGMWFGDDPSHLPAAHNVRYGEEANVMPVYLNIKRPLVIDNDLMREWSQAAFANNWREFPYLLTPDIVKNIKSEGYDGIIHTTPSLSESDKIIRKEYITFDPEQIKSAIGNEGTFDPANPVITKKDGGEVTTENQTESRSLLQKLLSLDTPQDMSLGETAVDIGAGFVPGVGTVQGARDFERARREGDTLGMLLGAAGMIPVAGGAVKAARGIGKASKAADDLAAVANVLPEAERKANLDRFMAASHAVDEQGQPRVMYHATYAQPEFDEFNRLASVQNYRRAPSMDTIGTWVTSNPGKGGAEMYGSGQGAYTMPLYVNPKKTKTYETFDDYLQDMHAARGSSLERVRAEGKPAGLGSTEELRQKLIEEGYDSIGFARTNWEELKSMAENLTHRLELLQKEMGSEWRRLEGLGYKRADRKWKETMQPLLSEEQRLKDSIFATQNQMERRGGEFDDQDVLVMLHPEQIKSAIGNVGTFDPTSPVITKKDGGEVSTEELLAQMDRIGAGPAQDDSRGAYDLLVEAERRAAKKLERARTESRGLLDRLNASMLENVTEPVAGSLVDMTVGLGDLGQMATKYMAGRTRGPLAQRFLGADPRTGIATEPVTPLAPRVREALGLSGYDPSHPVAIGTQIALPALRTATTVGRAANAANLANMATRAPRPGSAQELAQRIGGEMAAETQRYAGAELGATIARDVAPGNTAAELLASVAGSTAINTAQSLDPRDLSRVMSGMTEIYRHLPTPETPFVGRLDKFIANLDVGRISVDELLARMRGKFRGSEILRVERAFANADKSAKLTSSELLEKLQGSYNPSDLNVVTLSSNQIGQFYPSHDNPWRKEYSSGDPSPPQGVVILRQGGRADVFSPEDSLRAEQARKGNATWRFLRELYEADETAPDSFYTVGLMTSPTTLSDLSSTLRSAFDGRTDDTAGFVNSTLDNIEAAVFSSKNITEALAMVGSKAGEVNQGLFNDIVNRLLQQGGVQGNKLQQTAYVEAFKRGYEQLIDSAASGVAREDLILNLPRPDSSVTTPGQVTEFIQRTLRPAINNVVSETGSLARKRISDQLARLATTQEVPNSLDSLIARTKIAGVPANPDYKGQHPSLSPNLKDVVSFSRTSDVTANNVNGMPTARGIYVHELQSDLMDDIRKHQAGVPRGATQQEIKALLNTTSDQYVALRNQIDDLEEERAQIKSNAATARNLSDDEVQQQRRRLRELDDRIGKLRDKVEKTLDRSSYIQNVLNSDRSTDLEEPFAGMATDSKSTQIMMIKAAVASALNRGLNFVALTSLKHTDQPQLYERLPQNAREVVKDLGEGFTLEQINLSNRDGEFPVLAITWNKSTSEGSNGVSRVLTQGIPFKDGGEVTTDAEAVKKLLSYLNK